MTATADLPVRRSTTAAGEMSPLAESVAAARRHADLVRVIVADDHPMYRQGIVRCPCVTVG